MLPVSLETIVGLVLAAGLSRRMGEPKLLLDLGGRPVIRWTIERLVDCGIARIVVVAGHEREAIERALAGLGARVVANPAPEAGQASSLRVGVEALPADAQAVLVALGDQPRVSPAVVTALAAALGRGGATIAAPVYREGRGNPVLFHRRVFPELVALTGDAGARALVARDPARVALVELDEPMPRDLDTRADYEALMRDAEFSGGAGAAKPPGRPPAPAV